MEKKLNLIKTPSQIKSEQQDKSNITCTVFITCMFCLMPEIAFANPILNALNWAVTLLTSTLARSAAILALAFLGYQAMSGNMRWGDAGLKAIGIVFIFGGATIVDQFTGSLGSGAG